MKEKIFNKKIWVTVFKILVYIFAAIGFFLTAGFFAVRTGLTNTKGIIDMQSDYFQNPTSAEETATIDHDWNEGAEWENFKTAISKDATVLKRVESETGVPARLIVSVVFVEQMRLYYSDRQLFKELFSPLKILGTQTQFSLGVSGIKPKTGETIEANLRNKDGLYYLGENYEHYLDFKTSNIDEERFTRLTDYKDRYYSYLYTALYLKQFAKGWEKSGFDISDRPEILATLFNIGFDNSRPNANPQSGGAAIEIGNQTWSFGRFAGEFYKSDALSDIYPKKELLLK